MDAKVFKIEIWLDNAVFTNISGCEVAEILRTIACDYDNDNIQVEHARDIFDSEDNVCGKIYTK